MSTVAKRRQRPQNWLQRMLSFDSGGSRRSAPNPMFIELARGLQQYQATWGRLPQVKIPAGAALKRGSTGKRVEPAPHPARACRRAAAMTSSCSRPCRAYQARPRPRPGRRHRGQGDDRLAEPRRRPIMRGGSRSTWSAPTACRTTRTFDRYVVVDSGAAEAYLFDRDRVADEMRVVVGTPKTKTPMMAVLMRNAKANPYWNVPPELVRSLTAKRVKRAGPLLPQELPLRGAVRLERQRPA